MTSNNKPDDSTTEKNHTRLSLYWPKGLVKLINKKAAAKFQTRPEYIKSAVLDEFTKEDNIKRDQKIHDDN